MQDASSEHTITRIQERPYESEGERASPAGPPASEGVGIPGEIGHRANRTERGQAPFHSPESKRAKVQLRERRRIAPRNAVAVGTILGALITQRDRKSTR